MSKLVVILGITGVQGGSVADTYLSAPGWKVRGVTRNPDSAAAKEWAAKGVDVVKGDLDDVESLKRAFRGADVIFGVTDFWTIWKNPESNKKRQPGQGLLEYCYEAELRQGRNVADAAATVPKLSRYIFSSMADATRSSGGKYTRLYHMDSKARAAAYAQSLPALAGKFSQIQAPTYFQLPWAWGLPTTPKKQADGSWRMSGIGPGNKGIPFGDVRRDLGPCVKAVAEAEPGVNLFAVGEYVSWSEYLETFCETQNLKYGGYDELSYEAFCELVPGGLGHEFSQNVLFAFDFGYQGTDPSVIKPDEFGVKMTPFREYCRGTDFSAILNV
ncbi:NmrA-like family domain-containing protein 1 [Tolypocladium ophioglossoides CBS 100239]|uniref:NmrA-like family domain-containing protein 1 n=1 Tax=Tolypocladium ophioglossoides (strain CBS 100239) TaxID=1163406 RepID=A0A0L0NK00_TOLOC|nr:NmrA-like family domain-containing protein 1 [Tolypocladium ophioglossoides CBS 100239]